jgi:O-antigen ligase
MRSRLRVRGLLKGVPPLEMLLIAAFGIGAGLSGVFDGYFDVTVWGPIALAVLALLLGLTLGKPAVPRGPAAAALAGLLAFALWALLSTLWGESASRSLTEGSRWLLYTAVLLLLLLLVRGRRQGLLLIGSMAGAIVASAIALTIVLVLGDGPSAFQRGRLFEPIGYTNGMAGYLLLGFWPAIALAEQSRSRLLSAAGIGAGTLLAALLILTQSRAVAPAMVISAVLLLIMLPGRSRRLWALLTVAVFVALITPALVDVYQQGSAGTLAPESTVRRAAILALGAAIASGCGWLAAGRLIGMLVERLGTSAQRIESLAARALLGIAIVGAVAGIAATGNPVPRIGNEIDKFRELQGTNSGTRFGSGGGNRYDYWRVAWRQFTDHPLRGVGAGNYNRTYFLERRTTENITQPHSLEFEALGELGVGGLAAILLFAGSVLVAVRARGRSLPGGPRTIGLIVASAGTFVVWLVHTSIDWLHRIPGLTGIALAACAVVLAPWMKNQGEAGGRYAGLLRAGLTVGLIALATVLIGRITMAETYRLHGRDALLSDPGAALRDANESLKLNGELVSAYHLKAAALERLGLDPDARSTLLVAAEKEPHNFVTWGLLGDLDARRGNLALARRDYRRASALNPREEIFAELAGNPRSAP